MNLEESSPVILDSVVFSACLDVVFHCGFEFFHGGELHLGAAVGQELYGGSLAVDVALEVIEVGLDGNSLFVRDCGLDAYISGGTWLRVGMPILRPSALPWTILPRTM